MLQQQIKVDSNDVVFIVYYAGYEWVGWRNDTLGMAGKPVEMTFEFDQVRNFSAVILHTNNMFSKDVQVGAVTLYNFIPLLKCPNYKCLSMVLKNSRELQKSK